MRIGSTLGFLVYRRCCGHEALMIARRALVERIEGISVRDEDDGRRRWVLRRRIAIFLGRKCPLLLGK